MLLQTRFVSNVRHKLKTRTLYLQDPSVQRAVAGTQPATLEDYQPFDKNTTSGSGGSAGFTAPPPTTNSVPPPSYPSTTQPQISAADFEVLHAYIIQGI